MSGFAVPAWVVIAATVAALTAICVTLWQWIARAKAREDEWHPLLNTAISNVKWKSLNTTVIVNETALAEAVARAFECLVAKGPWGGAVLRQALAGLRVQVNTQEAWESLQHEKVSGQAVVELRIIAIGPSFAALAHELAHVAEYGLDGGKVDYAHASWSGRGIQAAVDSFTV